MNEIGCWIDDAAAADMRVRIGNKRGNAAVRVMLQDAVFVKNIRGGYECMIPSEEADPSTPWADWICYPDLR